MNLSFNGLTGVNSLCSIYFTKDAKKKVPPIFFNFFENCPTSYLTENGILNSFDYHGSQLWRLQINKFKGNLMKRCKFWNSQLP